MRVFVCEPCEWSFDLASLTDDPSLAYFTCKKHRYTPEQWTTIYISRSHQKLRLARYQAERCSEIELELEAYAADQLHSSTVTRLTQDLECFADGCVLQAYGALDAFACALAHWAQLPSPNRTQFSHLRPSSSWDPELARQVALAQTHVLYGELRDARHLVAHRGLAVEGYGTPATGRGLIPRAARESSQYPGAWMPLQPLLSRSVLASHALLRRLWAAADNAGVGTAAEQSSST